MSSHKPRRRVIPKRDFRPRFDVIALNKELANRPGSDGLQSNSIDYVDAANYVDRKAQTAALVPKLRQVLRTVAHSFITNHQLIADLPKEWEDLGARSAYEAAHILTVAECVEPNMAETYRQTLYDGIDLGDHAVRINEPRHSGWQ